MRKRNYFFRTAKSSRLSTHFQQYRNMRNKTVTMLGNAKKAYFNNLTMKKDLLEDNEIYA